ncbi:MAG: metallophosphoesterase [Armatimonadetes bacterium]|nr:metallophosphoesterase [Armatimonadota bacterium]
MLVWLGALAGIAAVGLLAYGALVEAWRFDLNRVEVRPVGWPAALDGLTILHLSDLHCRRGQRVERHLAGLTGQVGQPDLVAYTGDFCEGARAITSCAAALAPLRGRLGSFAVLGNNDCHAAAHTAALCAALGAAGVEVLCDEARVFTRDGASFALGGLAWVALRRRDTAYRLPVEETFAGLADMPRILLAHSPDAMPEAVEAGVDLLLAGHTHGGQICLPGGRALHNNLYRFGPPTYTRGLYREGRTTLLVSAGLGMTRPCVRLWCRPEALLITLRSGS